MSTDYSTRLSNFLPTQQDLEDFKANSSTSRLLGAFDRLTTWFGLLQVLRSGQEPSALIASAHSKVIEIWILMPLGLLHSSYAALRTVIDICTSYTFYHSHSMEWRAVCEGRATWEGRATIIDWHLAYTPSFREINRSFGLVDTLSRDYQELSSYVHGVPGGGLPTLRAIERTRTRDSDLNAFIGMAEKVDYDLNLLFLSVFHRDIVSLSNPDFRTITREIDRSKLRNAGITLPRV